MSNKRETPAKQLLESLRKRQKEGGGLVLNIEILMDLAEIIVAYEKMAIMEAFIDGKYFYRKGESKKRAEDYYNEKYN